MYTNLPIEELLVLARANQRVFDKSPDTIELHEISAIMQFKLAVTPSLVESLCLRIIELECKCNKI